MQGGRGREGREEGGRFTRGRKKERGKAPFLRLQSVGTWVGEVGGLGMPVRSTLAALSQILTLLSRKHFRYAEILLAAGQIKKK